MLNIFQSKLSHSFSVLEFLIIADRHVDIIG